MKLKVALTTIGVMAAVLSVAALPAASAASCTVTVTLTDGQTLYFQLPEGAPVSSLNITQPIKSVTESCPDSATTPATTTTPTTTTTTSTGTTPTPTSTGTTPTTTTTTPPPPSHGHSGGGGGSTKPPKPPTTTGSGHKKQPSSNHGSSGSSKKPSSSTHKTKTTTKSSSGTKSATKQASPPPPVTHDGVPTPSNPTFSFALPGPAPIGVPNFFIDSFQIPPFLLPIYQAAGIEYDVPWQVLAAINEIETDYGRNLSVSTAGAIGWMQFMPSTWKLYGVDANGDGVADPYNPADAIFTAARYLHAAGASSSLSNAIYAYNHASWYVQSVLLRAKLIGGLPAKFVDALTGLVQGHFPVAAPAKYADDSVLARAKTKVTGSNAAVPVNSDPTTKAVHIFAAKNAPVIAVNDGKIVGVGHSAQFGNYIQLQDSTGNVYTYAQLGSIPKLYPVPKLVKVSAAEIAQELSAPSAPKPNIAASAGVQNGTAPASSAGGQGSSATAKASQPAASAAPISLPVTPARHAQAASAPPVLVKERLFADPARPASYAAGGAHQVQSAAPQLASFSNYFSDALHLGKDQYTLQPLKKGAIVVAGTILGRIGAGVPTLASHVDFMIRPAGKKAPYIDPKPILDGWKLLEATAVYRAANVNPFFGPNAKNPSIGQLLLMSKQQLENRVLSDPHVKIYDCGRRDIQAGLIDRRILATIEFLSASSLDPTISGLECGSDTTVYASTGVDAAGATGSSMDISAINNIPVKSHTGAGSIADLTIRRLLTLQGALKPDQIISTMSYKGESNTMALPDHANRIQVAFTPLFGANPKVSAQIASLLKPAQWADLINRLNSIPEPVVPIAPSHFAIKPRGGA